MESLTRNTAYKVWISDLLSRKYSKGQEQFDSGYININGKNVSRVNLVGGVIDKFVGSNYISLSLDDSSGVIILKAWNETVNLFLDVGVGDLVLAVGKVKDYNNSRYISTEFVRKLDNPLWLKVRKLELVKLYGEPTRVEVQNIAEKEIIDEELTMNIVEEKVNNEVNLRVVVLGLVENLDFGDGADLNDILKKSGFQDTKNIIDELLKEGEIFELHSGKLRITG